MNKVAVGRFGSPYGLKGWLKIISYTSPVENILNYLPWQVIKKKQAIVIPQVQGKLYGEKVVASFNGCQDRDQAAEFTNLEIYVDREQLPSLDQDDYYWVDLIGLTVVNTQQDELGVVDYLLETGANDVIVTNDEAGKVRAIPYIESVVKEVDLTSKRIVVDWDADF